MDDDNDFGADPEFLTALASSSNSITNTTTSKTAPSAGKPPPQPLPQRIQQPVPQKIQQPTPQRLDKPPPQNPKSNTDSAQPKIVQPTPQPLPQRAASSVLVSPRQKGNPVLASLRSVAWEYSDIPADYGLGVTTCALFLSLKYHRLHPEYIYTRIRNLEGRYNLRILLTMVDIPNHEDPLRELSKTSLVNNVTIILCWSAAEAARYLELYKSYEHANFNAIKGQQVTSYTEKLVEFVTVPRGINKADSVSLVSAFGSLRNAINAEAEQVAMIGGWGEKKVKKWCSVVEELFRVQGSEKRSLNAYDRDNIMNKAVPLSRVPRRSMPTHSASESGSATPYQQDGSRLEPAQDQTVHQEIDMNDEDAMMVMAIEESKKTAAQEKASGPRRDEEQLSEGIAAALAKLRDTG